MQLILPKEKAKCCYGSTCLSLKVPISIPEASRFRPTMEILINNQLQEIPDHATLITALTHMFPASQKGFAVAVNNNVVSRNEWPDFVLKPSDKVSIIRATQGG